MALLDRIKERAAPNVSDAEINAMVDAIAAEIDARLGPVGPVTVDFGDPGAPDLTWQRTLRLTPRVLTGSALTVIERNPGHSGDAGTQLAADDFRLLHGGRTLQRLTTGTHPAMYWAPLVSVTYTPDGASQAERDEATIKLATIDLSFRGLIKSEKAGDYQWQGSVSSDAYSSERAAILDALARQAGMVMA